jgi:hypothetical protein
LKRWLIGIDEAGYGPKMGPLVIGASIWSVPTTIRVDQILHDLRPEFQSLPWRSGSAFLPLGDSKVLYRGSGDLESLAFAIRSLLDWCNVSCDSPSRLLRHVAPSDVSRVEGQPWYHPAMDSTQLSPIPLSEDVLGAARGKLAALGIEFHGFRCRVIDEEEFNRSVAIEGNKANALGEWSWGLLRDCLETHMPSIRALSSNRLAPIDSDSSMTAPMIEVHCDRQGGRKRYAPLLHRAFGDWSPWFEILEENATCSRYRCRFEQMELAISFRVQGDAMLPAAAASMLAKWIRELLMKRLNRFWRLQLGDALPPTAGYPVDAERFRREIENRAGALGHRSQSWWRCC